MMKPDKNIKFNCIVYSKETLEIEAFTGKFFGFKAVGDNQEVEIHLDLEDSEKLRDFLNENLPKG
jgi:hypothetical protein